MTSGSRTRAAQRAASEAAILDAAVELYAHAGPDGVSLRAVAHAAGVSHTLVVRYFGSKQGLVEAVEDRMSSELSAVMHDVDLTSATALAKLLTSVEDRPLLTKLIVRSGLGDLEPSIVPSTISEQCPAAVDGDRRSRLCGYAATSLILGWLSWAGFLVPALQLGRVSRRRRIEAVATATASVLHLSSTPEPALVPRWSRPDDHAPEERPERPASDALLEAAIDLFARHGPASVSIRDIARRAGVNHSLVHRHFGNKDELLAEAVDVGSFTLLPGALAPGGFDVDAVVRALHDGSPSPRTIARVLVDDIAVRSVRRRYPVLRGLLQLARQQPADARPAGLADPRLAAAAGASLVVGSVIWGEALRATFGLVDDRGVESAMADIGGWMLGAPTGEAT